MVVERGIKTAVIILLAIFANYIAYAIIYSTVKRIKARVDDIDADLEQRADTLGKVTQNAVAVGLFGFTVITILSTWGIDIRPLLTGAGVVGLAIGFGSQTLVRDVVTGFFILVENQFNTGDRIKAAGLEGTVIDIKLRSTVLRGTDGETHIIPNSQIGAVTRYKEEN